MLDEVISESLILIKKPLQIKLPSIYRMGAVIFMRIVKVNSITTIEVYQANKGIIIYELIVTFNHNLKTYSVIMSGWFVKSDPEMCDMADEKGAHGCGSM